VPAELLHLVRHGEVENPAGILYGRLPGYGLSNRGSEMAGLAAEALAGRAVTSLVASPLQRTQESAAPFAAAFGLPIDIDERIIEPWNVFEGTRMRDAVRNPANWKYLRRPRVPSWGEPYTAVRDRVLAAMADAWDAADTGEVVLVSHQMPIWTTTLAVAGRPLPHDPRKRRTALSSITTFRRDPLGPAGWTEVGYQEPAAGLLAEAIDTGAV
jgi:broad specificity phosphatase PhoE